MEIGSKRFISRVVAEISNLLNSLYEFCINGKEIINLIWDFLMLLISGLIRLWIPKKKKKIVNCEDESQHFFLGLHTKLMSKCQWLNKNLK